MKKKYTYILFIYILAPLSVFADMWQNQKNTEDNPVELNSPVGVFIEFGKAAANKDKEKMRKLTTKTKLFMLEKDPNVLEKFDKMWGKYDWERKVEYTTQPAEEAPMFTKNNVTPPKDAVVIYCKAYLSKDGTQRKFNAVIINENGNWKVK